MPYRCEESGWKLCAMNDPAGRRGIWYRLPEGGGLEMCAGREGDDYFLSVPAGPIADGLSDLLTLGAWCIVLDEERAVRGVVNGETGSIVDLAIIRNVMSEWMDAASRELGDMSKKLRSHPLIKSMRAIEKDLVEAREKAENEARLWRRLAFVRHEKIVAMHNHDENGLIAAVVAEGKAEEALSACGYGLLGG